MGRIYYAMLSVLLIATWQIGSQNKVFASQSPTTQNNRLSPWEKLFDENPDPPRTLTIGGSRLLPWEKLFEEDPPPPRKQTIGGSRGPRRSFCAIAPSALEKTMVIWNEKPLFFWLGKVEQMEVHDGDQILWSPDVSSGISTEAYGSAIYDGKALQPGQTYDWVVFDQPDLPTYIPFQIMAVRERDAIAKELTQLETQLKQQKATAEMIALAKANYFAQHHLWSDVLQEAASVKNPSPALTEFLRKIPGKFC